MFLIRKQPAKSSIFLCRCTHSQPKSSGNGQIYSAEKFFFLCERQREGGQRRWREQLCFPSGCFLPLSRLFHHSHDCSLYYSHCQVPFILPHSSSLYYLQEKLSLVLSARRINNSKTSLLPSLHVQSKVAELAFRGFSSFNGTGVDFDFEIDENFENLDSESEDAKTKSKADPLEVNGVCRVIDELFAHDRNMEAVLDGCGINLSHDLVIDVLGRFCHARKPAFRFLCWAGQKQGFAHDSMTYILMLSILGKNGQFETMVSLLEEMGEKGLLTRDTFSIAIRAFAASKEMKKVIGIYELMKEHKYKVGVGTINSLLDSLGRARLGKEAVALFDMLECRFMPNLQTYAVLLNGWCKVKTLMEAGRIGNEMIDMGFKPDTVAQNIIEGLLRSKKMSEGIKLLTVMKSKGPSLDVRSYTILIRDQCKRSKMNEVVKYFEGMVDSGCTPDAAVYKCLITGFGNQRQMDMVPNLLKEMKEMGCPPDGRTYSALIKLLTSGERPDDAEKIYITMVQSGIKPTTHTYNMIMKSYFQARNFEMGRAVQDEMSRKGFCPDWNSYSVFIGELISQGRSGEACKYMEEMLEKGMRAPKLDYNKFMADFSRMEKPDIMEELTKKLKSFGKYEVSNVL